MGDLLLGLLAAIGRLLKKFFNLKLKLKFVLPVLIISVAASIFVTHSKVIESVGGETDYEEASRYIELKKIVQEHFIDEVTDDSMTDSASEAIVNGLGDTWSYYMSPDAYTSYQLYSSNDYSDIGMSIMKNSGGGFQVVSVTPGSAAANAGLLAGSVITSIDGVSVMDSDIDDVRQLIRSRTNEVFTIGLSDKTELSVDCTATYVSAVSYRLEKTEAGYIQISNFEAGSGQDAINAIEDLLANNASAICIDVRNNAGGLSTEIAKLLDYLLPSGELYSLVDKTGKGEVTESDAMSLSIPMVVLVNSGTYAEAEVFAAVLQEFNWATIMGDPTTGMTRIQETFELDDGSAARISTMTYLTAKGVDISKNGGVIPDTILYNDDPSTVGTTEGTLGSSDGTGATSEDTQLMEALRILS